MRPEPAPTTWMIEAHSAFLSMSPTEAFWTLRILPRIGSSAWNSELRASLAVPSAESPSTMNSSVRSLSAARQSASLAGSAEDSRAFLRRWVSLCWRAAIRVLDAADDLLHHQLGLGLLGPLGRGQEASSARPRRPCAPTVRTAGVPRISLVWPSNCGSASRTVTTAVSPSRTSSLITSASLTLSALVRAHHVVERLGDGLLEAAHVGAALGGGDHVDVTSAARCRSRCPSGPRCRRRARARPPAASCGPGRRAAARSR